MKKTSLALFLSSLLLISGCSFSHKPGNVQISQENPEDQLKNSAFAISMATDYRSAGGLKNNPGGSIIFYNPKTKKWTDFATQGLEAAEFSYDEKNLYFYDYKTDYTLNSEKLEKLEHSEHKNPIISYSFPIKEEGGGSIFLDNIGFANQDGELITNQEDLKNLTNYTYRWDVIISKNGKREIKELKHHIDWAVQCEDGSIWGRTSPYSTSPNNGYTASNSPAQFLPLYPNFSQEPVATFQYKGLSSPASLTVCHKQTLYYLTDNFKPEITDPIGGGPDDYSGSSLISYNTETGEFKEKEITGDLAIRMSDDMWHADIGTSMFVHNDNLYWVSGNGSVIKTNLETAQNTKVFELEGFKFGDNQGLLEFKDKYLFQFKFTEGKDADIYRYNLETGEMEKHSTIPDYIEVEKEFQFPYDIEIIDLEKMLAL